MGYHRLQTSNNEPLPFVRPPIISTTGEQSQHLKLLQSREQPSLNLNLAEEDYFTYYVRTKRSLQVFTIKSSDSEIVKLEVGDAVVLRADRGGQDVGIISQKALQLFPRVDTTRDYLIAGAESHIQHSILRPAERDEVMMLIATEEEEMNLLPDIQQAIDNIAGAKEYLKPIDVEYQFDKARLTIFYIEVNEIADEDEFLLIITQELMKQYKTRIFLRKVDPSCPHDNGFQPFVPVLHSLAPHNLLFGTTTRKLCDSKEKKTDADSDNSTEQLSGTDDHDFKNFCMSLGSNPW
jgi:hypothetical protein